MYGLSQTDICKATGIASSTLSQYCNGSREPRQKQIALICDAYGINPAWLMGYDVPMKDEVQEIGQQESYYIDTETEELIQFIKDNSEYKPLFDVCRGIKKEKIMDVITMLGLWNKE